MPQKKSKKSSASATTKTTSQTKKATPAVKNSAPVAEPVVDQAVTMLDEAPAWGFVLLQGILILLMGMLILSRPIASTFVLVQIMGLFWLIDGVIAIFQSIFSKNLTKGRGWTMFGGIIGVLAGLVVLNNQVAAAIITPAILLYMVSFVFIFQGIIKMFLGWRVGGGDKFERSWGSFFAGVFYLALGVALIGMPLISGLATVVLTAGWLAMFAGFFMIISAFQLKKYQKALGK